MNDEVIEKVLEFSIKVQTDTGKEKLIRFTNINGFIDSSLSLNHDDYDYISKIKFELNCLSYAMEIADK